MNRTAPIAAALAVLPTLLGAATGCLPAEACNVPDAEITRFDVTVTTGRDATDADIFFCVERVSNATRECTKMGVERMDDWDIGSIQTYEVPATVAAGDLAGLSIENRGDAPDLSLDGNDWELDGVRVVAQTASAGVLVFDEQDLGQDVDAGERYAPDCFF